MSDSPTLNDDSELRKKVADILVDAHTHQHWTCMPDCIDHEKSDSPIDQLMQLIHQRDEARDKQIKDPTFQDVIHAGICPTPEEYKKMIWMLNWYRKQLTTPKKTNNN